MKIYQEEMKNIIELLTKRGFLIEEKKDFYCLSDNSHKEDYHFLDRILQELELGYLDKNGTIIVDDITNAKGLEVFLFHSKYSRVKMEICVDKYNWDYFKHRKHGRKVAVEILEPYIARYVKAISACGVLTAGSCDGNHLNLRRMVLQLSGESSILWHSLICECILEKKFNIPWTYNYTSIKINKKNKYNVYLELNDAADFLYNNRMRFREIKSIALSEFSHNDLKNKSNLVKDIFKKNVINLFTKSDFV